MYIKLNSVGYMYMQTCIQFGRMKEHIARMKIGYSLCLITVNVRMQKEFCIIRLYDTYMLVLSLCCLQF